MKRASCLAFIAIASLAGVSRAELSGNLLLNPGAELGTGFDVGSTVADWTVGGTSNPGRDNGTFDGFTTHSGSFDFYGGSGGNGTLSQLVPLSSLSSNELALVDSGTDTFNVDFFEQSLDQGGPNDAGEVKLTFEDGSKNTLGSGYDSGLIANVGGWKEITGTADIPADTRYINYEMIFTLRNGTDVDSFIDDNGVTVGTPASSGGTTGGTAVPLPSAAYSFLLCVGAIGSIGTAKRMKRANSGN